MKSTIRKASLCLAIIGLGMGITSCDKEEDAAIPSASKEKVRADKNVPGHDPAACISSIYLVEKGITNSINEDFYLEGSFGEYDLASILDEYVEWKSNCP